MAVSTKPPSGFRDFLPDEMRRRDHVFGVIETVFQQYGFDKIDTPCVENLSTLLGKYGDEGDQLLFRILNRGDKLDRALTQDDVGQEHLAEAGLRYDLTVPLARVFAKYRNDLPRIFKRYQIAPVWRADRPQRGRYREFYQCDVDIIGSDSILVEAEVTAALADILNRLSFENFRIHVNHRGVLRALIASAGIDESMEGTTLVALDKLDKIGVDGVKAEMSDRGLGESQIDALMGFMELPKDNVEALRTLGERLGEPGAVAIANLTELFDLSGATPAGRHLVFDPTLARGLSYYTGPIFEIRSDDFKGSLGGGGRYDELIGMFMKQDVPACGFSLGVERILVLMEERGQTIENAAPADAMIAVFDASVLSACAALAANLRKEGKRVDLYCGTDKLKKQFAYADERNIPFVLILGPSEIENGTVSVKDLQTGDQASVPAAEVANHIGTL